MAIGTRKEFFYWIAAALAATAALAAILTYDRGAATRRTAIHVTGNPEKGTKLFYGSKHCSVCHAVNGNGGRIASDLGWRRPGTPAMGWMTTVLWNHAPGMWRRIRASGQTYPHLDQEEMADMLAFLYQVANTDPPPNIEQGKQVFIDKGCVHCHSVNGSGGNSGPDLSRLLEGQGTNAWISAMWNHTPQMVDPVTQAMGQWPQLDGKSMNNLVAYASNGTAKATKSSQPVRGDSELGWKAFQAKCIQCHSVHGQGGNVGPGLGPETDLPLTTSEFAAVLWNHAPAMAKSVQSSGVALPKLEGDDIVHLTAFLSSLRYVEPEGSQFVGEKVFADRGCSECHGTKGEGGKMAPPLRKQKEAFTSVSFATALWRHGPRMLDRALEKGMTWPVMQPSDVGDLVAFLNTSAREK